MNKEEIEKAKIGLWNIRADCLKIIQCGLSDRQDREGCLKEIDVVDDIFKYIKELEQKSEKLDKVTDLLTRIATENVKKYNSENQKEVDFSEWNLTLEVLNVIEENRKKINELVRAVNKLNKEREER